MLNKYNKYLYRKYRMLNKFRRWQFNLTNKKDLHKKTGNFEILAFLWAEIYIFYVW